jgi:hypothetical protein
VLIRRDVEDQFGQHGRNLPHITQPFDTYDRNEMKMILSVRNTAIAESEKVSEH